MPYNKSRQDNWWKRRTKLEKQLACTTIGMIILAVLLFISLMFYRQYGVPKGVCLTSGCVHAASEILNKLDAQIDPCEDFYTFSCGSFVKNSVIPDDEMSVNTESEINDILQRQLRSILEEPMMNSDIHVIGIAKSFYSSCMNEELINHEGLLEAQTLLNSLGGWPVLEEAWDSRTFNWIEQLKLFKEHGLKFDQLISVNTAKDARDSYQLIITIDEPKFELDKNVLQKGMHDNEVKNYFQYLVDLAVLFGANDFKATEDLEDVLHFEIELANIVMNENDRRNVSLLENRLTIGELRQLYSFIDWTRLLQNILPEDVKLYKDRDILVPSPRFLDKLEKILKQNSARTIANYLILRGVQEIIDFLPQTFENRYVQFKQTSTGIRHTQARWKKCINIVNKFAPVMLSTAYVRKYLNDDVKNYATEIVEYIRDSFKEFLERDAVWMEEETKNIAIEKANNIIAHVAYDVDYLDDNIVNDMFANLYVNSNMFLQSYLNIKRFESYKKFNQLLLPKGRGHWSNIAPPTSLHVFYSHNENSITLPAAILQGVLFDKDRPGYLNFGGIGSLIGHELTHAFDYEGRLFDKFGNMRNWWEPKTTDAFIHGTKCFTDKFDSMWVEELGQNVSGLRTLSENIADNGGSKRAYFAYEAWVDDNDEENRLPGLEFTPKQLFWIASAQIWCNKERMEGLKRNLDYASHTPSRERVNGNFQNIQSFTKDFKCPIGSKMNPKKKCPLW